MTGRALRRGAWGLLGALALPLGAADLPRREEGVINGKDAVGFWVTDLTYGPFEERPVFPSEGYSVHLMPRDDPDRESVYPCGTWFLPQPGSYRFLIEGNGRISPFLGGIQFSGTSRRGQGTLSINPVVDAGTVEVSARGGFESGRALVRFLHVDSHLFDGYILAGMVRQARLDDAVRGVTMPAGPVLATLREKATGRYLAIGRPAQIPVRGTVRVDLRPPEEGEADVLVAFQRLSPVSRVDEDDIELRWHSEAGIRPADVRVPTRGYVYGVWYGRRGEGAIEVEGAGMKTIRHRLALDSGGVIRVDLAPSP